MNKPSDKYSINNTDYKVGQDNIQKWGFDVHNAVFGISAGLVTIFLVALLAVEPALAKETLDAVKWSIVKNFDVFFMLTLNAFVLFCVFLVISPYGKIKIGGEKAISEYSNLSWLSMMFAAGMGIALLFWGIAEPAAFYTDWYGTPLHVEANTPEAAKVALGASIYHWGFHGWGLYALVGLSMAFFAFNKGLPLSMRSMFYPLLGDKTWGWAGHIIDILAVLATLFGLATSLAVGAQQAASGLSYVFGIDNGTSTQLLVIAFVTAIAIYSVSRGMHGGVKILSNLNLVLALAVFVFVVAVTFSTTLKYIPIIALGYLENFIPLSNPFGRTDEAWMHGWTVFYWAWWVSWSPCVGMFIARISKGRTVREFILGVMLIPTFITMLWMAAFGGNAIEQIANEVGELGKNGLSDISLALFYAYDAMPMSTTLSVLSIVLIMMFFVTSSDSASLVIDSITSGGKVDAPIPQRIFWATTEGSIAAVLLWVGGKEAILALQAATVSTGLPFTFILIMMCVSLAKGLHSEMKINQYNALKTTSA